MENKERILNLIKAAVEDLKKGKFLIVVDIEREAEGDFVIAAQKITPEAINFMAKNGRGLICAAMESKRLKKLKLGPMVRKNTSLFETDFTVSVDAKEGTTTGISAFDRAKTIKKLIAKETKPQDLAKPGHVFPIRAKEGGVLARRGHTESAVDLAKLAGLEPAGVICEIMSERGTMAKLSELKSIAKKYDLKIIDISDLVFFRNELRRSRSE